VDWDRGWVIAWYVLIALLVLYEIWSVVDGRDTTPPLTRVIVREVPWWVTMPFLVWLVIHFGSRYAGRPIM
jgi:hypothetical protein